MKLAVLSLLILSFSAAASTAKLMYSTGPYKGQDMMKNQSHFGYDEICFTGNPMAARKILFTKMANDIETENPFVRYVAADKALVYGYTDTKCTDEMANDPADCRNVKIAKACK